MHDKVTPTPKATPPVEKKTRAITLTHRAPIQIIEDEWPIIAEGKCRWAHPGGLEEWAIELRVRRGTWRYIVYGNYDKFVDDDDDACQRVRVGRVVHIDDIANHLDKVVLEVGEQLRDRIEHALHKKEVTYVVDACFASMTPQPY